jgi:hypothetical protein
MAELSLLLQVLLAMQEGVVRVVDLFPELLVSSLFDFLEDHVGLEQALHQSRLR